MKAEISCRAEFQRPPFDQDFEEAWFEPGLSGEIALPTGAADAAEGCVQLVRGAVGLRDALGDGLNDEEFTRMLRHHFPNEQGGFSIACFSNNCLTLSVPAQDSAAWYGDLNWVHPAKAKPAREIAEKYGLALCEPPDKLSYVIAPSDARHHIEMATRWENVVVAHPLYLKLRLYPTPLKSGNTAAVNAFPPAEELARDLAQLYV